MPLTKIEGPSIGTAIPSGLLDLSSIGQIKFPAIQNASSDANTLDDYEEGTWTPSDQSGAGLSFTSAAGYYVKIGKLVIAGASLNFPSNVNGNGAQISLPFASELTAQGGEFGGSINYLTIGVVAFVFIQSAGSKFYLYKNDGNQTLNSALSGATLRFTAIYRTGA